MHHHKRSSIGEDYIIVAACVVVVGLTFVLFILCKSRRSSAKDGDDTSVAAAMLQPTSSHPLSDIEAATGGFHPSRIIGKGRVSVVYEAISAAGVVFVAKRMHPHLVLGNPGVGFSTSIKHLSHANGHPNVVPVLGYSEAPGERIIIYEYAGARSLDDHLHGGAGDGSTPPSPAAAGLLGWALRLRIAAGAARGIEHLHEGSAPGIVHGRVKPSNVMVDGNFDARVCDYGLASLFGGPGGGEGGGNGMVGYVDREGRGACKENDVYGFGVVLLEVLSGRRCEGGKVVEWALPLIRAGRVGEVLDPRVGAPADMGPMVRAAKVASACVGNGRRSRPSMAQVAAILSSLEMQPCV